MRRLLLSFTLMFAAVVVPSCMYDDTPIWNKINDHEERIETLEELCREMNTNIAALQALIEASENGDYITNVAPVTKDGQTIGYTITFAKGDPITIYNGTDGRDGASGGSAPEIGVREDVDGIYYWTINGEWLTDENGNKVKAVGTDGKDGTDGIDGIDGEDGKDGIDGEDGKDGKDGADGKDGLDGENGKDGIDGEDGKDGADGKDGIDGKDGKDGKDGVTPRLKIENDYWYVSYDDGATWQEISRATTDVGSTCPIVDIEETDNDVIFYMTDGSTIVISKGVNYDSLDDNKIYYRTVDGRKLYPYSTEANRYGAMIVSNTYEDGQGVLMFDGAVTRIGDTAFKDCEYLLSIELPKSVTEIGQSAFEGCSSLYSIIIPENLTKIGKYAFEDCITLGSLTLPASVTEIGYCAFVDCGGCYSDLVVHCNIPDASSMENGVFYRSTFETVTIDNGRSAIGDYAFAQSTYITEVTFCDGVTAIGDYAFDGCYCLENITIPDGVTSIGAYAFYDCTALTSIVIPDSVTSIGSSAFYNCCRMTDITLPKGITEINSYTFALCTSLENVVIPENVATIGKGAFEQCYYMNSITIPASVTKIDSDVFDGCAYLSEVYISDLSAWCKISFSSNPLEQMASLYLNGELLTEMTIPSDVEEINYKAFSGCSDLTDVTIPGTVKVIGSSAFDSCFYLERVTIEDGVTKISSKAFNNCCYMESMSIPQSVTEFGAYAFQNCTGVLDINCDIVRVTVPPMSSLGSSAAYGAFYQSDFSEVIMGEGVTGVGSYAFYNNVSLKSVTFGENVSVVGMYAFAYCYDLESVYLKPTTPPAASKDYNGAWSPFKESISESTTFYVPAESLGLYLSSSWSNFPCVGYDFL